jgi:hypothetical protein
MPDEQAKLFIPNHEGQLSLLLTKGGPRAGAGRKRIGITKKVSVTLSQEIWDAIEKRVSADQSTKSEVIRGMIEHYYSADNPKDR